MRRLHRPLRGARIEQRPELLGEIADRFGAQLALAQLGYDVGEADGVIGLRTRKALRSWQRSVGVPADGYLTLEGVQALLASALMLPS